MLMKRLLLILVMATVVCSLIISGCAGSTSTPNPTPSPISEKTWKLDVEVGTPETFYLSPLLQEFADNVRERTNGNVDITIHWLNALGIKDKDLVQAVGGGELPMGVTYAPALAGEIPLSFIADLPLLSTSPFETEAIWHGNWDALEAAFAERNLKILSVCSYTKQIVGSINPVVTLDDWKGLLIRAPGGEALQLLKELGANPVVVATEEMYLALQRGTVEAVVTSVSSHYSMSNYEVLNYIADWGWYNSHVVFVNMDLWQEWPDSIKYVVLDEAMRYERIGKSLGVTAGSPEPLLAEGMELTTVSQEVIDKCYELAPAIWEGWANKYGPSEKEALAIARELTGR